MVIGRNSASQDSACDAFEERIMVGWNQRRLRKALSKLGAFWRGGNNRFPTQVSIEALEERRLLSAVLVKDVNTAGAHSSPSNFVDVNGTLFFTASSSAAGREL